LQNWRKILSDTPAIGARYNGKLENHGSDERMREGNIPQNVGFRRWIGSS
jgi:hypothetical protein